MISRRLAFAAVPAVVLLVAIGVARSRISWQPVSIDLPASSFPDPEPQHLPIAWRGDRVWLLVLDRGAKTYGSPGVRPKTPQIWQVARSWNRNPVPIVRASPFDNGQVSVGDDLNLSARSRGDEWVEVWRDSQRIKLLKEKNHKNRWDVMQPGPVNLVSLSPDGKHLAINSSLGGYGDFEESKRGFSNLGLVLFDVASGRQIARQNCYEGGFTDVTWSPDGGEVAGMTADGFVFILNAQTGKLRLKFRAHQLFGAQIAWSPDGRSIVTASNPRLGLALTGINFAFKSGEEIMSTGIGTITVGAGKSKRIIAAKSNGDTTWNGKTERLLKRFDAQTGQPIGSPLLLQTGAVDLAYSPNGSQIALGEHNFALVLNAQTLEVERRLNMPTTSLNNPVPPKVLLPVCVAWSPDGATITTSTPRGLTFWRIR